MAAIFHFTATKSSASIDSQNCKDVVIKANTHFVRYSKGKNRYFDIFNTIKGSAKELESLFAADGLETGEVKAKSENLALLIMTFENDYTTHLNRLKELKSTS